MQEDRSKKCAPHGSGTVPGTHAAISSIDAHIWSGGKERYLKRKAHPARDCSSEHAGA